MMLMKPNGAEKFCLLMSLMKAVGKVLLYAAIPVGQNEGQLLMTAGSTYTVHFISLYHLVTIFCFNYPRSHLLSVFCLTRREIKADYHY